jgi:hypothetical protein
LTDQPATGFALSKPELARAAGRRSLFGFAERSGLIQAPLQLEKVRRRMNRDPVRAALRGASLFGFAEKG